MNFNILFAAITNIEKEKVLNQGVTVKTDLHVPYSFFKYLQSIIFFGHKNFLKWLKQKTWWIN